MINGQIHCDDRGVLKCVNDFDFSSVKRFYQIQNHKVGTIRAWHAHKKETKWVYVVSGAALIGVVNLATNNVQKFVLTSQKPAILEIPPNHANGWMNLDDTTIIFFSSNSLNESLNDDIRYPYDKWDIWNSEPY